MDMKHTPTPWSIESTWSFHTITDPAGDEIAEIMTGADGELCHADQDHELMKQNEANARHIVHCVNNHERLVNNLKSMVGQFDAEECNNSETDWMVINEARTLLNEIRKGESSES